MPRFVDLSHIVADGMITYPGLPGPRISDHLSREESRHHYESGTEFHIGRIEMVANTGTYLDTPFHRFADDDLVGLPLDRVAEVKAWSPCRAGSAGDDRGVQSSTSPAKPSCPHRCAIWGPTAA